MRPDRAPRLWIWLAAAFLLLIILIIIAADLGWAGRLFPWVAYVPGQDVTAHFVLIGGLAMLVNLALNRRTFRIARRPVQLGSVIVLLLVTIEEFSQLWISTRGFSLYDLSADILGILILGGWGSAMLQTRFNPGAEPPTPDLFARGGTMKLAVGSDERTPLTDAVLGWLDEQGHTVERLGPLANEALTWPLVARSVAQRMMRGDCEGGILLCWTGTGVSMAANKFDGIRAALCDDAETARGARLWNDANVLCLSLRRVSIPIALEILEAWFETDYIPNAEDDACLAELNAIEHANRSRETA